MKLSHINVWTNLIFFITSIYTLSIAPTLKSYYRYIFLLLGIAILINGLVSVLYHCNTPSYHDHDITIRESEKYIHSCNMDISISMIIFLFSVSIIAIRTRYIGLNKLLGIKTLYLTLLFLALSAVFYGIGLKYDHNSDQCNTRTCFELNLGYYDIFHSIWHIFIGFTLLFGISTLHMTLI